MKTKLLLTALMLFAIQPLFAQPNSVPQADWNNNGKDTIYAMKYVSINTSSPDSSQLRVVGEIKSDSLIVKGGTHIFGKLHVGFNSLSLAGAPPGGTDEITSTNGKIFFGGDPDFTDIKVGIGTTYTPTEALDVYGSVALNGYRVLSSPDIGNIFVGHEAGVANILGSNNTFTGWRAGFSNTGGDNNCFFGHDAGHDNTNGVANCFFGAWAGYNNEGNSGGNSGSNNVFVGGLSGYGNVDGYYNTYIGHNAQGTSTLTNATAIGSNAYVTQPNSLVLGSISQQNNASENTKVGIGTTAPADRLSVGALSQFRVNHTGDLARINDVPYFWPGSPGGTDTYLKNNGSGNLSWAPVNSGLSQGCSNPTVLSSNSSIKLIGNNFYFDGTSATSERVGVGVPCGNALTAKFNVNGNTVIGNGFIGTPSPPANGLLVEGLTGIGTTSPQQNLSVNNGMNIDQANANNGTTSNILSFGSNSGEGIGSKRTYGGNLWGLDFYTGFINRMVITNGGNVGIGTTTPAAKLHVYGTGDISVDISSGSTTGNSSTEGTPYMKLIAASSNNKNRSAGAIQRQIRIC